MNSPIIYFCEQNFEFGTDKLVDDLADKGYDIEIEPCLGYCGECSEVPFALVNDELITADSVDELKRKILEILNA